MKGLLTTIVFASLVTVSKPTLAETRYVDLNNINATLPYTSWATAATNIQDAIDAAETGDFVLVTNGVYSSGGRVVYGGPTNRVVVDKAVTVSSVNGAGVTIIQGNRSIGNGAVRCAYLVNDAVLSGFTLMNGATWNFGDIFKDQSGGGAWCESTNSGLLNCVVISNSAAQYGGGVYSGASSNSGFALNRAGIGGGAFGGVLVNCTLGTNSATYGSGSASNMLQGCSILGNGFVNGGAWPAVWPAIGAGAFGSILSECVVAGNTNPSSGAGLHSSIATSCIISNNHAMLVGGNGGYGGGAYESALTNCVVSDNSAKVGGGVYSCEIFNSIIIGNRAVPLGGGGDGGGGVYSTFYNCLIASNRAGAANLLSGVSGVLINCTIVGHTNGLAFGGSARNCIIYNNAVNHTSLGKLTNSCTWPLPPGPGNFTNDPVFVDLAQGDFRLQLNSPCINAGNNRFVTNFFDLDGNVRVRGGTVDVGAYEFQASSSVLSYAWAQQYGFLTDGSADFTDVDGDGLDNFAEWRSDTNPTNGLSVLGLVNATNSPVGARVTWQSVSTRNYWLERATNFSLATPFQIISTNISGAAGTKTFVDVSATNGGPYFYRVGVH